MLFLLLACVPPATDTASDPTLSSGDCSETPRLQWPGLSLWQFEVCVVEEAGGTCQQEFPQRDGAEILYNCDPSLIDQWILVEIPAL